MKYLAILTIDSWHLANGVHCPSLYTYGMKDSYDEVLELLLQQWDDLEDFKGNKIDSDYIYKEIDKTISKGRKHTRISFKYPREGYLEIVQG